MRGGRFTSHKTKLYQECHNYDRTVHTVPIHSALSEARDFAASAAFHCGHCVASGVLPQKQGDLIFDWTQMRKIDCIDLI